MTRRFRAAGASGGGAAATGGDAVAGGSGGATVLFTGAAPGATSGEGLGGAAGMPVMNGESASSQCGGQAGVSDTLLDALWFADWIGIMAEGTAGMIMMRRL